MFYSKNVKIHLAMKRKLINKNYIFSRLGSFRFFWRLRHKIRWLNFERRKASYTTKNKLSNTKDSASVIWRISLSALPSVAIALAVTVVLYILELNIESIKRLPMMDYVANWMSFDREAYIQMLVAIPSVIGIFIGLYFTAVNSVLSDVYKLVPDKLRSLVLKHTVKNGYINSVAFLIALSLFLLGLSAIDKQPIHLAVPVLIVMACVAVFAFINLFINVFRLSDPTTFFNPLYYDLRKWIKLATSNGDGWRDPSFQEYYRNQAHERVTTMLAIAKMSSENKELRTESFPRMLRKLLATVDTYYDDKRLIPSDSNWYSKKREHKQWYLSDSTDVDMATQTGTTLSPSEAPDNTWFEDAILNVFHDALFYDLKSSDYESLYKKSLALADFYKSMGEHWLIDDGKKWIAKLSDEVIANMSSVKFSSDTQELNSIGVADIVASLPISLELGFMTSINKLDVPSLRNELKRTNWVKPKSPYKFLLPLDTIKTLEKVHDGAIFEKSAGTLHKTQGWYVSELTLNNLDWFIYRQWNSIMEIFEIWYSDAGKQLSSSKKYNQSAAIYSRAVEQAWKLHNHLDRIQEVVEQLREDVKLDFNRPDWNWDKEQERVSAFRTQAIEGMADLIPEMATQEQTASLEIPDFFGGAVHFVGEACYDALAEGDVERFKTLFPKYFVGILGVFDRVRPQIQGWTMELTWLAEPLIDLINLSGYSYIYAEYHNKPEIWSACKGVWDNYLGTPSELPRIQLLSVLISHHKNQFAIAPRENLRSRWAIHLANMINSIPVKDEGDGFRSRRKLDHTSDFISNIAPFDRRMPFMTTHALEVFVAKYLIERSDASGLDFGVSQDVIDDINRKSGDGDE